MTTATISATQENMLKPIKPMALPESLILFGVPAALMALSVWWLWPALVNAGFARPGAYVFSLSLVNAGLMAASLVGYLLEGNPLSWAAFANRMRLTQVSVKVWLWTLGSTLFFGIMALVINSLAAMVYRAVGFSMPDLAPGVMTVWMHVTVLFFNIVGEELWWRGYILPRQELTYGNSTWFIHGTLWACFHMFKWWAVPFMVITCQVIPFVAQKTKNTWPGMINHFVINGAGVLMAAM